LRRYSTSQQPRQQSAFTLRGPERRAFHHARHMSPPTRLHSLRATLVFRRIGIIPNNMYSVNIHHCSAQDKHGTESEMVLERGPRFLYREGYSLQHEFRENILLHGVRGATERGILSKWILHGIQNEVFLCRPFRKGEKRKVLQLCNVEIYL